jgi:hypothetical protein
MMNFSPLTEVTAELENGAEIKSAAYPRLEEACFVKAKLARQDEFKEKYAAQLEGLPL